MNIENNPNNLPDISELFRFKVDGENIDLLDIFDQEVIGVIFDFMHVCTNGKMKMIDVIRAVSISGQCGILVNENYKVLQAFLSGFLMGGAEYNLNARFTKKDDILNSVLKDVLTKLCDDMSNESGNKLEVVDCIEINPSMLLTGMIEHHNKDIVKGFFKMHVKASHKLQEDESLATQEEIIELRNTFKNTDLSRPVISSLVKSLKDYPKYAILSDFFVNEYVVKNVNIEDAKKICDIFSIPNV